MTFSHPHADVFVPDGLEAEAALARVTQLCIGAHQDDIEIMAHAGITACFDSATEWFGGVVATDGAGSPRTGAYSNFTDAEMQAARREEQRQAAKIGRYGIQLQLAHPSVTVKSATAAGALRADLTSIFSRCSPQLVFLHNPADKHDTHVGLVMRCLEALRDLPPEQRPARVLGCEVWRDLDWLVDADKVALDAGQRPELAEALLKAFDSQISGGKRYDRAALGRRLAHATFHTSHATDQFAGITWAMDLTPLIRDDQTSVADYTLAYVDRLREDIASRLKKLR